MDPIRDIEDLFEKDARGDILDSQALMAFSSRGPLQRLAVHRISIGKLSTSEEELKLVWEQFHPFLLSNMQFTPESTLDLELALMALQAFTIALQDHKSTRTLVSRLCSAWPRFHQWLSFLVNNIGDHSILPEGLQNQMFTTIHEFFTSSSNRKSLFKVIVGFSGTMSVLAKCWSLEVSNSSFCLPGNKNNAHTQFPAASTLIIYLDGRAPHQFEEMKTVLSPISAADIAIDHISHTTSETDMDSIYANLCVLLLLGRDAAIRDALYVRNPVREVTRIFYSLASNPPMAFPKRFIPCIIKCRFALVRYLETTTNLAWFTTAVNAKLLPAILQSIHHEPETQHMILTLLSTTLPKYMIFPCVIYAVAVSIRMIDSDGLENRIPMMQSNLGKLWTDFKNLSQIRVTAVGQVDRSLSVRNICSNAACRQLDTEANFKRCKGCSDSYYCSRDCQKQDWQLGLHRTYCKDRLRQGDRETISMSKRDWLMIEGIIRAEVKAQQEQLVSCLHKQHFSHIVVEVDHTTYPANISVDHVTSHRPEYNKNIRERSWWQRTVETEKNSDRGVVIRAWIPGMDGAKSWVCLSSTERTQEWICNTMPDGRSMIPGSLFIQSGLVTPDPVWDMLYDFEA